MMLRATLIGLLFLLSVRALCQDRKELVQLSYTKKLHGVHMVPFNEVTVIDNRFDTTKLKIMPDGSYPMPELVFDRPASIALSDYIKRAISQFPQTNRHLYIDLRQFRFGNITGRIGAGQANNVFHKNDPQINECLFFSATAYYQTGDGRLKRILSFKRPVFLQINGLRGDMYQRTVLKAIDDLIIRLCTTDERQTAEDTLLNEQDLVGRNVMGDWVEYPINKQPLTSNGLYPTFDEFSNNKEQIVDFSLRMNVDSNYELTLPPGVKKPWGLYYNGSFYLAMNDPYPPYNHRAFYLPLEKKNNTFYFYLPHSLPNMYAFLSATQMGTTPVGSVSGSGNGTLAGAIVSAAAAGVQLHKNSAVAGQRDNVLEMGMNSDWRRCFLDMDSGDIVY